jgi:AcrR family transcriptional regulator
MVHENANNDIKERIIDSSRRIFARFGFKKTTMNEIALGVNRTKSSIYHYFKSKEELFETVIEKEGEVLKQEISKAIEQETLPQRKLYAYIKTKMSSLESLVNFYNALKDEYLNKHYEFIRRIKERFHQYEFEVIKGILNTGIKDGTFIVEDVEDIARAISIALKGFEHPGLDKHDTGKMEVYTNMLTYILFKGIKQT